MAPLELDTPMGFLESVMAAGDRGDWERASAALDLAKVGRRANADSPQDLSAKPYDLLHPTVAIDWASLPDRPDAVDTTTTSKDPIAGAPRRSIVMGYLEVDNRTVQIRIARVQAPGSEPLWVFSRQSVANVPKLYVIYGPSKFEEAQPSLLRKQAFWTFAW
jgi:hypothetical protein